MLLEIFRQGLQLCFNLHLNRRSEQKIMGLQSCKSLNFRDKMTFGCYPMAKHREYYKGEGGGFL
jgi:hypothetical protein